MGELGCCTFEFYYEASSASGKISQVRKFEKNVCENVKIEEDVLTGFCGSNGKYKILLHMRTR